MSDEREAVEQRKAGMRIDRLARIELDEETAAQHAASWRGVLASDVEPGPPLLPDVLRIGDDAAFYRGKVNWLYGDNESCKTWISYYAVVEQLRLGRAALVVDFEMGQEAAVRRLQTLGATPEDLSRCRIVCPNVAVTDAARAELSVAVESLGASLGIVVIDSVAASLASSGLNFNQASDVEWWVASLPRWLCGVHPGAAVVVIDHTSHEGSHATGSKRKGDTADLMLYVQRKPGHPISVEQFGYVTVTLTKDRQGRKHGVLFEFEGGDDHEWKPRPPGAASQKADVSNGRRAMIWEALDAMRSEGLEDRLPMEDLKSQLKGRPGASSAAVSREVAAMAEESILLYNDGQKGIGIGPSFDLVTFAEPSP